MGTEDQRTVLVAVELLCKLISLDQPFLKLAETL